MTLPKLLHAPAPLHPEPITAEFSRKSLAFRSRAGIPRGRTHTVGALIFRIRVWGTLYYVYNKEPPRPCSSYSSPYINKAIPGVHQRRAPEAQGRQRPGHDGEMLNEAATLDVQEFWRSRGF